jgi:hypothetical protein
VKELTPETFEAVWTFNGLAATGMDESAAWRNLLLAVVLLGMGCGLLVRARRSQLGLVARRSPAG